MATDTRQRLVDVSSTLFQRQGLAGTGIKQILTEANARFSSLYHHFPNGKNELAAEAIRSSGERYESLVAATWNADPDVVEGLRAVFDGAAAVLEATNYADACPIAGIALEVASTNEPLRIATAQVFQAWTEAATSKLRTDGLGPTEARRLAVVIIGLLEGAFLLCRAAKSTEAMVAAGAVAAHLVEEARSAARSKTSK